MREGSGKDVAAEQLQEKLRAAVTVVIPARHVPCRHLVVEIAVHLAAHLAWFDEGVTFPEQPVNNLQTNLVINQVMVFFLGDEFVDEVTGAYWLIEPVSMSVLSLFRLLVQGIIEPREEVASLGRLEGEDVIGDAVEDRQFPTLEADRITG